MSVVHGRCLPALGFIVLMLARPVAVEGRVGFAEWEVYTPGGHMISDTDSQESQRTPCLRTAGSPDSARILVERVERWRYHDDHVVGKAAGGYFVFEESTGTLTSPGDERAFAAEVRRLGRAVSPWLTPADGWKEAWFPFMVWRPCRVLLDPDRATAMGLSVELVERMRQADPGALSPGKCHEALDPARLALYDRTTWGRNCREWVESNERWREDTAFLESFCDEVLAAGR